MTSQDGDAPRKGAARPRPSARERAHTWISSAILAGDFAEGEFLDEITLAREVGTSRTPVREAFHRLQAEGFVDLVPRRGAQVRVINARELEEIYQARFLIESEAILRICRKRKGAPERLEELLDGMETAGRKKDWRLSAKLDQEFHLSIVQQQGNDVVSEMYESLGPRHVRLAVRTLVEAPERLPTIQAEHRELANALQSHDGSYGVQVLRKHLRIVPEVVEAFPQ
ncbi:GntR family transcriptional regulator [Nesterenkonia natronophila]|uniref:GntR family transcriptional regulator n=1 Tax=Nesterenkonia natronophila TaxID=2174932 RepID=A0A3A4F231_9MICC|nr:GntR family transcriptional regulator [Nesterenkonia natronophila]RJN31886.1 GntR family transcriptional regulator [Nesterenkonia natronophila]